MAAAEEAQAVIDKFDSHVSCLQIHDWVHMSTTPHKNLIYYVPTYK